MRGASELAWGAPWGGGRDACSEETAPQQQAAGRRAALIWANSWRPRALQGPLGCPLPATPRCLGPVERGWGQLHWFLAPVLLGFPLVMVSSRSGELGGGPAAPRPPLVEQATRPWLSSPPQHLPHLPSALREASFTATVHSGPCLLGLSRQERLPWCRPGAWAAGGGHTKLTETAGGGAGCKPVSRLGPGGSIGSFLRAAQSPARLPQPGTHCT